MAMPSMRSKAAAATAIAAAVVLTVAAASCASPTAIPTMVAVLRATASPLVSGPPRAIVDLVDGRAVPGALGSYELNGVAADAPRLPASALVLTRVAGDQALAVRFADGTSIGGWTADVAAADDPNGSHVVAIGSVLGLQPPIDIVPIGRIPTGTWVLEVRLFLADGSGDASYYWSLDVR